MGEEGEGVGGTSKTDPYSLELGAVIPYLDSLASD